MLNLFAFVNADLQVFRPGAANGVEYGEGSMSAFGTESQAEPRFPKSLYLVRPLFSAYDLNPVAASAQASVPIPEGLNLDAWIVPPPQEDVGDGALGVDGEPAVVKVKKSKKGKGKAVNGGKTKKPKAPYDAEGVDTLAAAPVETEEERAEREQVRIIAVSC